MLTSTDAEKDSAAGLAPPPRLRMPWRVSQVQPLPGDKLHVRFLDGLEGLVDMAGLVRSAEAGVFTALVDAEHFNQVYVDCGVVTWPGEIDLAPDAMHAAIKTNGTWILDA